ncbi:MAG: AAA family ATPase, partial [Halobacteriaceae archaeon]
PVVTMGDIIREETAARGLDPSEHHGEVARALRDEEGDDAVARRALPVIKDRLEDNGTVLVDGIRSDVEVDVFEDEFGDDFTLVSIEAPFEQRLERLDLRGRDNPETESLHERDARELGFGMGDAMHRADISIVNDGSLSSFRERFKSLLTEGENAI